METIVKMDQLIKRGWSMANHVVYLNKSQELGHILIHYN